MNVMNNKQQTTIEIHISIVWLFQLMPMIGERIFINSFVIYTMFMWHICTFHKFWKRHIIRDENDSWLEYMGYTWRRCDRREMGAGKGETGWAREAGQQWNYISFWCNKFDELASIVNNPIESGDLSELCQFKCIRNGSIFMNIWNLWQLSVNSAFRFPSPLPTTINSMRVSRKCIYRFSFQWIWYMKYAQAECHRPHGSIAVQGSYTLL